MPLYDYSCNKCSRIFDEFVRIEDYKKDIWCPHCDGKASRMMSLPHTSKDLLYQFTDMNTTGKPVEITSKGHWNRHLKKLGMTDDIRQTAPRMEDLKQVKNEKSKEEKRGEYKKVVETVLREKGAIR